MNEVLHLLSTLMAHCENNKILKIQFLEDRYEYLQDSVSLNYKVA